MLSLPFQIQIVWKKAFLRIKSLNCDLWISIWVSIGCLLSLSETVVTFWSILFCVLRIWLQQLSDWGPPEYGWKEVWFTPHLQLESYQLSSALGNRLSFSFFWSELWRFCVSTYGSMISFLILFYQALYLITQSLIHTILIAKQLALL